MALAQGSTGRVASWRGVCVRSSLTAETPDFEPIPSGQDGAVSRPRERLRPTKQGSAATVLLRSRSNSWIGAVTRVLSQAGRCQLALVAWVVLSLAVAACSDSTSGQQAGVPKCVPGKVESCPCGAGGSGNQTCDAQGSWGACVCGVGAGDTTAVDALAGGDAASTDLDSGADATGAETTGSSDGTGASDATGASDLGAIGGDTGMTVTEDVAADAATGQTCSPCGHGSLKGKICAPSEQVYVNGATVTLTVKDCDGKVKQLSTTTDLDGNYAFAQVPCGKHTAMVTKGAFKAQYWVTIKTGQETNLTGIGQKLCFAANAAKIAVFWGQWDKQHTLLDELGFKYTYYNFEYEYFNDNVDPKTIEAVQVLRDFDKLKQYEVLFFNCGSAAMKYANMFPEIGKNIKTFVHNGGSIYASDLSWAYIEAAFPDAIDFYGSMDLPSGPSNDGPRVVKGNQNVPATVKDAALAQLLGLTTFSAKFGAGPLVAVLAAGQGTTVHVSGVAQIENKNKKLPLDPEYVLFAGPVVLSHQPAVPGAGRVVYTTFHNDEQADEIMVKLLNYLVFLL